MTEEILIRVILVLLLLLVVLWVSIALSLYSKKRRQKHLQRIEEAFSESISRYLYPMPGEETDVVTIQKKFRILGITSAKRANVQFIIDLMIRTQRSLLGRNHLKLQDLYERIPPYKASYNKLKSRKWYVKARGIREIYEMGQNRYINSVLKCRNHRNVFVRREAQIAIVVFMGWESLRFLPYLKREMELWQQIKIVEKLHYLYPEPNLNYLRKAYDSDKPYASELVMRIIRKFRLSSEVDYILRFINSVDFDRRETAIYCISSFALDERRLNNVKYKFLNIPNTEQQMQLLKYIEQHPSPPDLAFYKLALQTCNDIIKLRTAEILWNNGYKEEVQKFYYEQYTKQPATLTTI
jgi:hypothetical protein